MRSLAADFVAVLLAGCAGMADEGVTPAQRLHASDGAYRALLSLAVAYKEACDARPPVARDTCTPVVAHLRELDDRYAAARGRAGSAGDPDFAALEAALGAFNAYVAASLAGGISVREAAR